MAAKIKKDLGIEAKLIKGSDGVFDVIADDKLIFSKHKVGRFPKEEEVIKLLKK